MTFQPRNFKDRADAGRKLAPMLHSFAGQPGLLVLGIPRGGVPVAFEVATALHAPLDVFLSRKLGVPGQEELAFGAITADHGRFLDERIVGAACLSTEQIEQITAATRQKLEERSALYHLGRPAIPVEGKTVLLVDDGIATGSSMRAAIHALKTTRLRQLVIATPVAPPSAIARLQHEADKVIALYQPDDFWAVGQFYDDFSATSDDEVIDLLRRSASRESGPPEHQPPADDTP